MLNDFLSVKRSKTIDKKIWKPKNKTKYKRLLWDWVYLFGDENLKFPNAYHKVPNYGPGCNFKNEVTGMGDICVIFAISASGTGDW